MSNCLSENVDLVQPNCPVSESHLQNDDLVQSNCPVSESHLQNDDPLLVVSSAHCGLPSSSVVLVEETIDDSDVGMVTSVPLRSNYSGLSTTSGEETLSVLMNVSTTSTFVAMEKSFVNRYDYVDTSINDVNLGTILSKSHFKECMNEPSSGNINLMALPTAEFFQPEEIHVNNSAQESCDRDMVVFNSEDCPVNNEAEGIMDDFFDIIESDVRVLYRDLQKQVNVEQALMTGAMRLAQLEQQRNEYEHVIIRIKFSDGLVIQGVFWPGETVGSVYQFVKSCIRDKETKFCLYTTPPRNFLRDMQLTLVQAGLAPASLIYFSSEAGCKGKGQEKKQEKDEILLRKEDMMELVKRKEGSDVIAVNNRFESGKPCNKVTECRENSLSNPQGRPSSSSDQHGGMEGSDCSSSISRNPAARQAKLPKWFRPGMK